MTNRKRPLQYVLNTRSFFLKTTSSSSLMLLHGLLLLIFIYYAFVCQDVKFTDDSAKYCDDAGATQLVQVQKKENVIEKSYVKLKEASTV